MAHYIILDRLGEKGMKCECKLPLPALSFLLFLFFFFPILASFFLIWKFWGVMEKIVTFAIIDPISFSFLPLCNNYPKDIRVCILNRYRRVNETVSRSTHSNEAHPKC